MRNDQEEYERRVAWYESEGICRSDAQAIVDAELLTESRTTTIPAARQRVDWPEGFNQNG